MPVRLVIATAVLVGTAGCTSSGLTEPSASTETPASAVASGTAEGSPDAAEQGLAGAWLGATADALGETGDWTNKVEVADLDSDGDIDLLFANGGDHETPGTPVANRVFLNSGDRTFEDATRQVFGRTKALARVIKVANLDGDRHPDIVLGTTYETQSRLFLGGDSRWTDVTQTSWQPRR